MSPRSVSRGPCASSTGWSSPAQQPIWPDGTVQPGIDAQARRCLEIILEALAEAGAGAEHVVRTRTYLVDRADADTVGRAHGEVFDVRPASTMIVVAGLLDPRWKLEIEAEAIIQ